MSQQNIMTRLKQETSSYHQQLESLPFFEALKEHRLPLESYINQLRALAIIHEVFEQEIRLSRESVVAQVWSKGLEKLPLIENDLQFFSPRLTEDLCQSIDPAFEMVKRVRARAEAHNVSLLGYLYVLEGTTLGNDLHQPDIVATFRLNEDGGHDYYSGAGPQVKQNWQDFSEKLNSVVDDHHLVEEIIEAACEAFILLEKLYSELYPVKKAEEVSRLLRINPQAGNHPFPEDEGEIRAALRASTRCWEMFGYYEQRYGQRGKRFSDSDTCWLVTLADYDHDTIEAQVRWLCNVLCSRGMPTLMMEYTLRYLFEELNKEKPDSIADYVKLLAAAESIETQREQYISQEALSQLGVEFEQLVGPEMGQPYRNTGELIVAAVVDEACGFHDALSSIHTWLTDPDRFDSSWRNGIDQTVAKTREILALENQSG